MQEGDPVTPMDALTPPERAHAQVDGWILGDPVLIRGARIAMVLAHPLLSIRPCLGYIKQYG
jgi:hypothetical protein